MTKKKFFLIIILLAAIVVFAYFCWFFYKNDTGQYEKSLFQEKKYNFSAEIKEINQNTITLLTGTATSTFFLNKDTKIFKIELIENQPNVFTSTLKDASIKDLKIGERASIYLKAIDGKMTVLNITIQ
jgi:hypothetical protein